MVQCRINSNDDCISCKTCKYKLSKLLKEFEANVEFDKKQGIQQYSRQLVKQILTVLKKEGGIE